MSEILTNSNSISLININTGNPDIKQELSKLSQNQNTLLEQVSILVNRVTELERK